MSGPPNDDDGEQPELIVLPGGAGKELPKLNKPFDEAALVAAIAQACA